MDEYLAFAKRLSKQAGQLIKQNASSDHAVERKSDLSPVTQVDKDINALISQSILDAYPEHGLLGEEMDHGTGNEELQWLCDPLDGTKAFIIGIPTSTCVLGLVREGEILLSCVYDPFGDKLYHAVKDGGAFCNDIPLRANKQKLEQGYVLLSESSFQFKAGIESAGGQVELSSGAAFRSMLVAAGRCAASVQGKADFHDVGPASLIVEEAGGRVTDLSGNRLKFDKQITNGIVISNGIVHEDLLAIVQATPY